MTYYDFVLYDYGMMFRAAALLAIFTVLCRPATAATDAKLDAPQHAVVVLPMHFHASKARTTAAFGPLAEAVWAPTFQPHFLFPQPAAQVAGALFRTPSGKLWLLHDFDPIAGLVQYIIVDQTSEATTLTIRVSDEGGGSSVTMTYAIVAFNEAGKEHIAMLQQHAHAMASEMHDAITKYLAADGI